jgi:hypothetical protein
MKPLFHTADRTYSLRSNEHYLIFTGVTPDNKQFVLGPDNPNLICLLFDARGRLVKVEHISLATSNHLLRDAYEGLVRSYLERLEAQGIALRPVNLERFSVPDDELGILDLPFHLRYDLEHADQLSESERAECQQGIEEWTATGNYVLVWGNEFHVDEGGVIISS